MRNKKGRCDEKISWRNEEGLSSRGHEEEEGGNTIGKISQLRKHRLGFKIFGFSNGFWIFDPLSLMTNLFPWISWIGASQPSP